MAALFEVLAPCLWSLPVKMQHRSANDKVITTSWIDFHTLTYHLLVPEVQFVRLIALSQV